MTHWLFAIVIDGIKRDESLTVVHIEGKFYACTAVSIQILE